MAIGEGPQISFDTVLKSIGVSRFFSEFWSSQVLHLPDAASQDILAEIGPLDISNLVSRSHGGTQAWLAGSGSPHASIPVNVQSAVGAFQIGATLYFVDLDAEELAVSFANFLGVPRSKVAINLFATPQEGGTSWHFDANENFTIQLRGTKRWWIAPNESIAFPPENHILGATPSASLAQCSRGPLRTDPPQPSQIVDLKPGEMLYVPRGFWHCTEALTECWSLNLCCGQLMWATVICEALYEQLTSIESWRGSAIGLRHGCNEHARALNRLPLLLGELATRLEDPQKVSDLLNAIQTRDSGASL